MKELTYQEVYDEWGRSSYKRVNYRDKVGWIRIRKRDKDKKVIYFIELDWYKTGEYNSSRISFESIHYDKVVSRFQRFVDKYCTDWVVFSNFKYKGYRVFINKERGKDFYIGIVQFHKNSTFKHIADTREEVERFCKNRIGKVIYEKEKVAKFTQDFNRVGLVLANGARKLKIQELEELQARISSQLEELKKEKDTLTYKEVVLELVDDPIYKKGILRDCGTDNPAPFIANSFEHLKKVFEIYVDRLENHYNLYRKLTGKEE